MLEVTDLTCLPVLDRVSFHLTEDERVLLIGRSGAGKSTLAKAIAALLPPERPLTGGLGWRGRNLLDCTEGELRAIRGAEIAYVPQDRGLSLHPAHAVVDQVAEGLVARRGLRKRAARQQAAECLSRFGLSMDDVERRPHELSGGMIQRSLLAMQLVLKPHLLIADEVTAALDPEIAQSVLTTVVDVSRAAGSSVLFIAHDFHAVWPLCDRVMLLDAGRIVVDVPTADCVPPAGPPELAPWFAARDAWGAGA